MIKFFRKIRFQLLGEGKTGKYLKYAIGEVILVVIGILIALSINTWNENRKNSTIEKNTLIDLKSDLESAMTQLDTKIEQNKFWRRLDSLLLDVIHFNKKISTDSLEKLILGHIFSPGFDPELGTLNEILSTGKMEIIKNRTLRKHISSWNKSMDELSEVDKKLEHLDLQVKEPLYSNQIPMKNSLSLYLSFFEGRSYQVPESNFKWDTEALLQNIEFENMLSNYVLYSSLQHLRLKNIKGNINEMITLINRETESD